MRDPGEVRSDWLPIASDLATGFGWFLMGAAILSNILGPGLPAGLSLGLVGRIGCMAASIRVTMKFWISAARDAVQLLKAPTA